MIPGDGAMKGGPCALSRLLVCGGGLQLQAGKV